MMKNLISLLYILYEALLLTGCIINLSWHTLKKEWNLKFSFALLNFMQEKKGKFDAKTRI